MDSSVTKRLRAAAERPTRHATDALRGTLVEADFERFSARLRTPAGTAVSVAFSADLADAIEEALRRPAEFEGEVTYDAETASATAIRLQEVHREAELWQSLETEDFWRGQSLFELEQAGLVRAVQTPEELQAPGPAEGDDLDAFFAVLRD